MEYIETVYSGATPQQEKQQSTIAKPTPIEQEDLKGFRETFVIAQILGIICVVLIIVGVISYEGGFAWRSNPGQQFNWHPVLMTIGLIYLYANSIMIYRALRTMRKPILKIAHAAIHTVVILCVLGGSIAAFDVRNTLKKNHLYSLHSWIGLLSMILFVLQWLGGLLVFLWPGAPMTIRAKVMPWHIFMGLSAFVLACAAALSGLNEKGFFMENYSEFPTAGIFINFLGVFVILFAGVVIYIVTERRWKRLPRPEDSAPLKS